MTTYTFSHLTVYIKNSQKNDAAFAALKTALPQLAALKVKTQEIPQHKHVLASAAFAALKRKALMFTVEESLLPEHTPKSYHRMFVETLEPLTPVASEFTILSIPIVDADADAVDDVIYGELKPVLLNLFGRDLFKIKRITARSDQSFHLDRVNSTVYEQKTGWRRLLSIFQPY